MNTQHAARIKQELQDVGMGSYGKTKFATQHLPKIIHEDEHIEAAIYGRYREGSGLLSFSAGMLVATNLRVIFLDHKPGFTSMDELTYDAVVGVKQVTSGISSTVTLHTRVGDYVLRFANAKGIERFMDYVERRRLDTGSSRATAASTMQPEPGAVPEPAAVGFLLAHDVGVLSTVDRTGNAHGAVVHYQYDTQNRLYIVTKASTQKARDMFVHSQVGFTIFDVATMQTAQISGDISVVSDPAERQKWFHQLVHERQYGDEKLPMPVTTIHEDAFVVICITPSNIKFSDYKAKVKSES